MNMSIFSSGFATDIFVRLAETLLHFVWQGGIVAVIVLIADRCLRSHSAQWRYAVQVAALLLMLACVPVTYVVLQQQQQNDEIGHAMEMAHDELAASPVAATGDSTLPAEQEPFAAIGSPQINRADPPQLPQVEQAWGQLQTFARFAAPYAAAAYLLGVALMFGRLALALISGHRLCSDARPVTEPDLLSQVARQARKIGLRAAPVVAWCGRTSVPLVAGLIKPMILLPVALASSLTPHQLEALLAHELAHLRRFDLLVNLLQRVAEALLFFHPAVWYVSRRISTERENCCDDSVLRAGWGRVEYADALVRMAEICGKLPGIGGMNAATILAAAGNNPSQFKRRILRLLGEQESLRLGVSRNAAVAILGGVLAVILAIPVVFSAPSLVAQNEKEDLSKGTPAKNDPELKNDREPEVLPGHYRVSFHETPWKEVIAWYGRVMGDRIDANIIPEGSFSYNGPRPLSHREISLLINRELLSRDYCLAAKEGGFSVQPAAVIARQYAEQLRKDFMHGYELKKGPDKFESYFELAECRNIGRTKPPAPAGPAISYVLKARRDFTAQEATSFFGACFADSGFPSVTTGESILADGFAVLHRGKWLGKTAPSLKKGEQIEVWQNYAQEWNSRPPRDYHLVIRGLITGNGKPVAGARVQQLLLEGAPDGPEGEKLKMFLNWAYGGESIVDKEGKFLVSINQDSQFVRNAYFHISAPGFAPQRVGPIAIDSAKPAELKIELKPGFAGRLRLVLPDGKPLDKGEVELTVQDDLWTWSQPMATLPVGGDPITVPNCPAGPLLLKVRVQGFMEQEVRDVVLVEEKVVEVQVAAKPQLYFRGKEALERIENVKPKWGESQHGIEFGLARLDDKRILHSDQRVRLEMFIRNTGKETVKIELAADFHANVPEIKDERGEAVKLEGIFLSGTIPHYQETLKPGEAFGFRYLGLGLGPRSWPPQWADPKPGKYTLRQTHKIDVDPVDETKPGKSGMFTTGTIEFEFAAPPAAKALAAEEPKAAPRPQEKLFLRGEEALKRIESVKPRWSQSQIDIEFGIA
ncbi:MAG: hypothetical protein IAF94_07030, partial [Pirellulaceae bacterium]|nr:hypothetical protein [Pirellulaceae bacterium]